MDTQRKKRTHIILRIIMAFMFLFGVGIFSYPFVVDSLNNYLDQIRIADLQKKFKIDEEKQNLLRELERENQKGGIEIPGIGLVDDPLEQMSEENKGQIDNQYYLDHTLGSIFIPAIHVSLPVYDETNYVLLDKGVTWLQGSSYPVGGKGTHSVLTGHSGVPDKILFTNLEKLQKKDMIYLHILGKKMAYEVRGMQVVKPEYINLLDIDGEKDQITLITCTPYSINTHRLLVTAQRVPYEESMEDEIEETKKYHLWRFPVISAGILLFLILFFLWVRRKNTLYRSKRYHRRLSHFP